MICRGVSRLLHKGRDEIYFESQFSKEKFHASEAQRGASTIFCSRVIYESLLIIFSMSVQFEKQLM